MTNEPELDPYVYGTKNKGKKPNWFLLFVLLFTAIIFLWVIPARANDSTAVRVKPLRVGWNTHKAITRAGYSVPYFKGRRYVGSTSDWNRVNLHLIKPTTICQRKRS